MEREKLVSLVAAAQKGDAEALNQLFSEFYNDVYYFALKTVKDSDLACDITQETFVEIINTVGDLHEPAAFVKWIRQITYHQCTRYFKKKRDVLVDEDEEGNTVFDIVAEERTEFIPDEALDQQDFRKTILAMMDTLSEEQRVATLLYYYDELSVKQIAEIQGVSEGTVKSRLNYARKSIKKSVEEYEKKNNVKLHSFTFFPFMAWLFKTAAEESSAAAAASAGTVAAGVTAATGTTITAAAVSSTVGTTTAGAAVTAGTTTTAAAATGVAAAGTGILAKIAALPLVVKVISAITAGAIVAGSVGVAVSNNREDPTVPTTTISQISVQTTPPTTQTTPTVPSSSAAVTAPATTPTAAPTVPHEHTYEETVVAATCTEQGYTIFTCSCGDSYEDDYVAATGHTPSEWIINQEATPLQSGKMHQECTCCGIIIAEEDIPATESAGFAYTVNEDGKTCTITGIGTCADVDLNIPEYIDGYQVTWIGDAAFRDMSNITYIILPDSVVGIGSSAFENCTSLTNIKLPVGLTSIPLNGFKNCKNLESITLPDTVTTLENSAFDGCKKLKTIVLPDGITYIGGSAFYNCIGLTSIEIPEGITCIEMLTFGNCTNLTSIMLPDSVTSIGRSAFINCYSLSKIILPDSVTSIGGGAFYHCSSLTSINIPDGITSIENSTFMGCSVLISINIPDGVTNIGNYAFGGCSSLNSIYFMGTTEQWGTITFGIDWHCYSPATEVICSDGAVSFVDITDNS